MKVREIFAILANISRTFPENRLVGSVQGFQLPVNGTMKFPLIWSFVRMKEETGGWRRKETDTSDSFVFVRKSIQKLKLNGLVFYTSPIMVDPYAVRRMK